MVGDDDELDAVTGIEFGQQVSDVGLDRCRADVEAACDFEIGLARGDQGKYFTFAVGDALKGGGLRAGERLGRRSTGEFVN